MKKQLKPLNRTWKEKRGKVANVWTEFQERLEDSGNFLQALKQK